MRFAYKNKEYEVLEMVDVNGISEIGLLILFEVQYASYEKGKRLLHSEEDFLNQEELDTFIFEEKRFINYLVKDSAWNDRDIMENCEWFIDHEYDKDFDELKYLLRKLKLAQMRFEKDVENGNDTKGSLGNLDDVQGSIYQWVKENMEVEENE